MRSHTLLVAMAAGTLAALLSVPMTREYQRRQQLLAIPLAEIPGTVVCYTAPG